jgi:hypothetical protein
MKKHISLILICLSSFLLNAAGNKIGNDRIQKITLKSGEIYHSEVPSPKQTVPLIIEKNMNSGDVPETSPLNHNKWSFFQIGFLPYTILLNFRY